MDFGEIIFDFMASIFSIWSFLKSFVSELLYSRLMLYVVSDTEREFEINGNNQFCIFISRASNDRLIIGPW